MIDFDTLNLEIGDIEAEMGTDANEGDDKEYDIADTIGKTLALVTQVYFFCYPIHIHLAHMQMQICKSPQACTFFKKCCN